MDHLDEGKIRGNYRDFYARTFGAVGTGALIPFLAIENPAAGGRVLIVVKRIICADVSAGGLNIKTLRATVTGGGNLQPITRQRTDAEAPVAIVRGRTAVDGGAAVAITTTTAADPFYQIFHFAGVQDEPAECLADGYAPGLLPTGQAIVASTDAGVADFITLSAWWREYIS